MDLETQPDQSYTLHMHLDIHQHFHDIKKSIILFQEFLIQIGQTLQNMGITSRSSENKNNVLASKLLDELYQRIKEVGWVENYRRNH